MKLLRRFRDWLRPKMPVVNIGLALGAYLANEYLIQGFCQPVPWVWCVLLPSVGAFLAWPWLKQVPRLNYLLLFLQGVLLPVCVYCTCFASPYLLEALLFGFLVLPLLLWTPVIFGVQVLRRFWVNPLPRGRWVVVAGVLLLLLAQGWAWKQYQQVAVAVRMLPVAQRHQAGPLLRVVPRTYMAERLAGRLFKYHESPEFIYDGWRPPLHDPLLNTSLLLATAGGEDEALLLIQRWNADGYPKGYWMCDIEDQAPFYHALFPAEPIKPACVCAHEADAERFLYWHPEWNDPASTIRRTGRGGLFGMSEAEMTADSIIFMRETKHLNKQGEGGQTSDTARATSHP